MALRNEITIFGVEYRFHSCITLLPWSSEADEFTKPHTFARACNMRSVRFELARLGLGIIARSYGEGEHYREDIVPERSFFARNDVPRKVLGGIFERLRVSDLFNEGRPESAPAHVLDSSEIMLRVGEIAGALEVEKYMTAFI